MISRDALGPDDQSQGGVIECRKPVHGQLEESDCLQCGGKPTAMVHLAGAYSGDYPLYQLRVKVPELGFSRWVRVAGVPVNPRGFEGIAGFRFLNRFTFGNFGNPDEFGLEC